MSIIEAVRKYLQTCPLLKGGTLNCGLPAAGAATYSVDVVPVNAGPQGVHGRIQSAGSSCLVLATRTYYGEFVRQQLDNLCFFEEFAEWLDKQNRTRSFPDLGDGRNARKLEVTTSRYVFATRYGHGTVSDPVPACPISRKENDK